MGARGGSGLYVGRGTAALLAALLLSLLVSLLVLAALYGRCRQPPPPARPAAALGPDPGVPGAPMGFSLRRLPPHLLPLHYELELWPLVRPGEEEPFGFSGQVNITVRCRQDTRTVVLHSVGLHSHRAAVRGPLPHAGAAVEVEGLRLEEEDELAVLELREPLVAGRRYVLQLFFHGRLREDRHGLFLIRYTDLGSSRMLVASQMEPAHARMVYPCFDEPEMKATFDIRIIHDPSYVALSNMPAIDVSEMKDENGSLWSVTTFNTSLKMSTYLTAFVVCDLAYVNRTERGNEIRIWARKEAVKNGYVDYALNITGPIFSFLEDLLNISYPLTKTDLIALPYFGEGAMENWGLLIFEEETLLYLPSDKVSDRKTAIALIVSHELAHQAGGKTFCTSSYLKEFAFSNANQDDLWTHVQLVVDAQDEVQLPASVKKIMDSWTCQSGFPVLTFNITTGTISQEKIHNKKRENSTDFYNNTWIVPISWMRNGSSQPLMWLDNSSKVFPEMQVSESEYDWILLNVNLSGYYRVKYDQLNLKRLVHLLENDPKAIPAVSRFQLLDDVFALRKSGYIEIEAALELTKYLAREDELFIWNVVLVNLVPDSMDGTLKNYEVYPLLKKYLLKRMLPIYRYYAGFIRKNVDALEDDYFAQVHLGNFFAKACWLGLQDCLDLSSELYTKWMDNPDYKIPFLIRRTVCCYGVAVGSDKELDFAWEMYKHNDSTKEDKDILLFAMSCAKESWLLHSDTQFSSRYIANILDYVLSKDIGHRIAWEFVTENWSFLSERYGNQPVMIYFCEMTSTNLMHLFIQLQVFYNNTLEEDERETATLLLESAKTENMERKEFLTRVADWLEKNTDD
uniref:Aminopeptidase n=1 Tax=Gallus gallus TaxID=9031 RepID=A0A8V0Y1V6_CHICK